MVNDYTTIWAHRLLMAALVEYCQAGVRGSDCVSETRKVQGETSNRRAFFPWEGIASRQRRSPAHQMFCTVLNCRLRAPSRSSGIEMCLDVGYRQGRNSVTLLDAIDQEVKPAAFCGLRRLNLIL